jgi:pimeloyl-ACP methyl ester carboxylesterase
MTLLLLLALLPLSQDGELATLEMQPVELELADGSTRTAFRGMLRVPVVRADPDSRQIGVDVWRFPADEGVSSDRPPVFELNGGPGWPGMEPGDVRWERDVAPKVAMADLVIVGQRGIGTSEPNTSCAEHVWRLEPGLSAEERDEAVRAQLTACRNAWEAEGYDLRGFNVIEAAGDVDDVRRLLGYDEIVLMGGSFGSHWGMTIMRYHPEIVARAVLHGMEGPDHTSDGPAGLLEALRRIAAEAEASPRLAERLPEAGLIEALRAVIAAVEERPAEASVGGKQVTIEADDLREQVMGYTCTVRSRDSVAGWPGDVMRLVEGDYVPVARVIDRSRGGNDGLPTASFFLLDCGSGITTARHERYLNDPAVQVVGDPGAFYDLACPVWEVDLGDEFRADFRTPIPTVMVHGTWDVSTPLDNALELVPCFEDLHFVPVEGGTHGALREAMAHDEAFTAALTDFITTGATEGLPEAIALPPIEWSEQW